MPIVSLIYGIIGLVKIRSDNSLQGKGVAISNIIVSVIIIITIAILLPMTMYKPHNIVGPIPIEEPDATLANSTNPITLSSPELVLDVGRRVFLKINVFNNLAYDIKEGNPTMVCPILNVTSLSVKKIMLINTSTSFVMLMNFSRVKGMYLCNICVDDGHNKCRIDMSNTDIIVKIQ